MNSGKSYNLLPILVIILTVIFHSSCREPFRDKVKSKKEAKDTLDSTKVQKSAILKNSFTNLRDFEVIKTLFNADKVVDSIAYWKPDYEERLNFYVSESGYCKTYLYKVFYYKWMDKGNAAVLYLSNDTTENNCHACAPILSIAIFEKNKSNKYAITKFKKNWLVWGSWGLPGKAKLVKIGTSEYAIRLDEGYGNSGSESSSCTFYDLYWFKPIFSATTYRSNIYALEENSPYAYEWTGEVSVNEIASNDPFAYYDIVVHEKGKKSEDPENYNSAVKYIDKYITYKYKGDQYEIMK